jgi:hypothetical protein
VTTAPVLDLRQHGYNSVEGLRLSNRLTHGTAEGYGLSAQRRSRNSVRGLCINITAPDGREIDMVGFLDRTATSAVSPLSQSLSSAVTPVLRENATPEKLRLAAQRLEAVLVAGLDCLERNVSGAQAGMLVKAAAEGIDPIFVTWWSEQIQRLEFGDEQRMNPLIVAYLHGAGFTPDTTSDWFTDFDKISVPCNKGEIALRASFRDHGWTYAQFKDLRAHFGYTAPSKAWAKVDPHKIGLAMRAGLSAREANTFLANGEWDEDMLNTLAALLGNHQPVEVATI